MQNTYNFHALSAWWLRNGVLDETVRGKGLQQHRKGNELWLLWQPHVYG